MEVHVNSIIRFMFSFFTIHFSLTASLGLLLTASTGLYSPPSHASSLPSFSFNNQAFTSATLSKEVEVRQGMYGEYTVEKTGQQVGREGGREGEREGEREWRREELKGYSYFLFTSACTLLSRTPSD